MCYMKDNGHFKIEKFFYTLRASLVGFLKKNLSHYQHHHSPNCLIEIKLFLSWLSKNPKIYTFVLKIIIYPYINMISSIQFYQLNCRWINGNWQ